MNEIPAAALGDAETRAAEKADAERGYEPPTFEVICLDCEISSYAPDGDDSPLF